MDDRNNGPLAAFDRDCLAAASSAAAGLCSAGVAFPLVLAGWRLVFLVPFAWMVIADVAGRPGDVESVTWLAVAVLVAVAGLTVPFVVEFVRDASAVWDRSMWSKYALRAKRYREAFFHLRILTMAFFVGASFGLALVPSGGSAEPGFPVAGFVWLGVVLAIGGYFEACEPPGPGMGRFEGRPRHA